MAETTQRTPRGRRTVARHGKLHSPHPASLVLKVLGIITAVALVSGAGVAAYAVTDIAVEVAQNSVELEGQEAVPPDLGAIEGGVNLFLAGTDACEPEYADYFGDRCTGADAGGELNDVNLLVHISDEPRRVTVVSFPRDLMLSIPECTDEDGVTTAASWKAPINAAYGYGGLSCVAKTVSQLSGQNIPFAAKITWGGVIEITDAIGGVEVCLASGISDPYTGINWPAGNRTISGIDALQFLRTRHGVGDGSDLGRISNQQQYMSRLANKLMSEDVLSNPALLYKLATTTVENITPSSSLTNPVTLVQIALAVKDVPFDEISFVQYPVLEDPDDPNRVVPDEASAAVLWAALDANEPIVITGDVATNGGVVLEDDGSEDVVDEASEPDDSTAETPTATPAPTETAVELPSSITGSTAADATCSNGNVNW
ncbi:LCP family protein [Microbacterium sp. NPDC076911]|uniref:LCP family protein n=1 Tax=Microbacterium sp. NPDC076911 TaxID=3154958 RepID=UPI00343F571C